MTGIALASVAVLAALYEWAAIKTRRVPTITETVKAAGWPARILVAGSGSLALIDHFLIDGGLI